MYCKFLKLSTFLKNYLRSLSLSFFLLIIYCLLFTLLLDLGGLQYIFRSQEISSFSASIPAHCAINTGYFCKILYSVLFPTAGCTWIIEMGNITCFSCGPFIYRSQSFVYQQHSILCAWEKSWQKQRFTKSIQTREVSVQHFEFWILRDLFNLFKDWNAFKWRKWNSNHRKWQQRIIKNDKWSIFMVYLENSWTYTILFSPVYPS